MPDISRRGTMAYIAIHRGIPVKAAAIIAGPSDLKAWADGRPDMLNGPNTYDGFSQAWPDYEHHAIEQYRARSAVYWADRITRLYLSFTAALNKFVPVTQALKMAEALQENDKVYSLHVYEHDGHSLPLNREDRNHKIIEWFNKFGTKTGSQ